MQIDIDLVRDLPKVVDAFEDKTLQMFHDTTGGCSYDGPCAIGIMMSPDDRRRLTVLGKHETGITGLIADGIVVTPTTAQANDLGRLQRMHDRTMHLTNAAVDDGTYEQRIAHAVDAFEEELLELVARYL